MIAATPPHYNCEALTPNFQVRWKVVRTLDGTAAAGTDHHSHGTSSTMAADAIAFELLTRGLDHEDTYMSLGVSGRPDQPHMIGGDVVVADYFQGKPRARDFYMNARRPCTSTPTFLDDTSQSQYHQYLHPHPHTNRNNNDSKNKVVTDGALGVCPDTAETFVNDVPTDRISGVRLQHGYVESGGGGGKSSLQEDEEEALLQQQQQQQQAGEEEDDSNRQEGAEGEPLDDDDDNDDFLTLIRYRHPVIPHDVNVIRNGSHDVDRVMSIQPGVMTTIIWALGPMDERTGQPLFHSYGESRDFLQWELGRFPPEDNCEPLFLEQDWYEDGSMTAGEYDDPLHEERIIHPFVRPVLTNTLEFRATLGPSGGERGYPSITHGRTPDNWAWYINGTYQRLYIYIYVYTLYIYYS